MSPLGTEKSATPWPRSVGESDNSEGEGEPASPSQVTKAAANMTKKVSLVMKQLVLAEM
jgi:hypothetical protein